MLKVSGKPSTLLCAYNKISLLEYELLFFFIILLKLSYNNIDWLPTLILNRMPHWQLAQTTTSPPPLKWWSLKSFVQLSWTQLAAALQYWSCPDRQSRTQHMYSLNNRLSNLAAEEEKRRRRRSQAVFVKRRRQQNSARLARKRLNEVWQEDGEEGLWRCLSGKEGTEWSQNYNNKQPQ